MRRDRAASLHAEAADHRHRGDTPAQRTQRGDDAGAVARTLEVETDDAGLGLLTDRREEFARSDVDAIAHRHDRVKAQSHRRAQLHHVAGEPPALRQHGDRTRVVTHVELERLTTGGRVHAHAVRARARERPTSRAASRRSSSSDEPSGPTSPKPPLTTCAMPTCGAASRITDGARRRGHGDEQVVGAAGHHRDRRHCGHTVDLGRRRVHRPDVVGATDAAQRGQCSIAEAGP